MNWEQAVKWYREQSNSEKDIEDNYFDIDPYIAAKRFSISKEFAETLKLIPKNTKSILDIGAGRGISSFAFAKHGINVTSLEPDPSNDIGAGAIKILLEKENLNITIVEEFGENLPFKDNSFDVVYVRQALHHAHNLEKFCNEIARVLKRSGKFIAVREHVLQKQEDLPLFLKSHPLQDLYGGENAFTLKEYQDKIQKSGLKIIKIIKPFDNPINYFPKDENELAYFSYISSLKKIGISRGGNISWSILNKVLCLNPVKRYLIRKLNRQIYYPGIMYSFVSQKP